MKAGGVENIPEPRRGLASAFARSFLGGLGPGAGRSILEVYCGDGATLASAAAQGWKCFGVEPSPEARQTAVSRHGSDLYVVDQVENLIPHRFDVVLLLDVLDRQPDPSRLLFSLFAKGAIIESTKVVITSAKETPELTSASLVRLLERLRFSEIRTTGFTDQSHPDAAADAERVARAIALESGFVCVASGTDFGSFMHERYVPGTWSNLAEYEHVPRYLFAKELSANARVLDFGCGTGYGAAMIAEVARSVVGLDSDPAAIDWATRVHEAPNLTFVERNDLGAGLEDGSFDVITCFEMIEHVDEPTQRDVIRNLARLLAPGGRLVISTPNPEVTARYGENPFHIRELDVSELDGLLRPHFKHMQVLRQWIRPSVSIDREPEPGGNPLFFDTSARRASGRPPPPVAFIAVCSQEPGPAPEGLVYLDSSFDFVEQQTASVRATSELRFENYQLLERAASVEVERAELQSFRNSRLYRLVATARADEALHRKLPRMLWILGSVVVPPSVKRRGLPLLNRLRAASVGRKNGPKLAPYVVRPPDSPMPDRPRVVHAIGNFMTGGSSRLVVDLVEHLGREYEQEVVAGFVPSPPAYVGLPVREYRYIDSPKPLLEYLSQFRPQIMHVHYWGEVDTPWYRHVFEAGRRYGCAIVENINTPVSPFVADWIRHYVFVSEYVRREFGRSLPRSRVIHPGSDLERFGRDGGEEATASDCIGMVYRLETDKLDEHAIDPFIETVRRRPQTKVLIVGGGSLLGPFQRAVAEAGLELAFEFTGYVRYEDLPALYERMSVFVAPVRQESFGQVSSFAMGMALPVAGYDVGALSEIVADRDLLAAPGDSDALAEILVALLDDRERRQDVGRRNRDRVRTKFSVEAMAGQYRRLYRELLDPST